MFSFREEDEEEGEEDFGYGARLKRALDVQTSQLDVDAMMSKLTVDVTLLSHTHGRERRAERGISREQLKAAVK